MASYRELRRMALDNYRAQRTLSVADSHRLDAFWRAVTERDAEALYELRERQRLDALDEEWERNRFGCDEQG